MAAYLSTSPNVDLAGAHMLETLHAALAKRRIGLAAVEAHFSVRDTLRIEGAVEEFGPIDRHVSLADVIAGSG